MTVEQVASFLNVSPKTVRRLVAKRELPCLRVGGQLRFSAGELQRWLGRNHA
jgi:excisionase family DNA binding protein